MQHYTYGDINNLTGEFTTVDGQTRSLGYEHNGLGHVSAITYPNSHRVEFIPNALGQATLVRNSTTAKTYAFNILYHPSGAVKSYTYGNNLRYSLTQNQQLLPENISVKNVAIPGVLVGFTYGYDNNLNISSIADNHVPAYSVGLTYDGLNRLKTANGNWGNGTFNYDSLGNIQNYTLGSFHLSYSYNSNKQLSSTHVGKSYSFSYDERGNVTKNTAAGNTFNYNLANQMTGIGSNTYTYDGHNRRVKKQTPLGSEYFIYAKAGTLLHNQKANGTKQNYIYLGNSLIAKVDTTANTINYVHTDHLGSVVAESNASGQITKRFHYKPFGESHETQQDDIGYTGHKHDADLGLTYMQARYYDPVLGRFYGNDPVGYVAKNPVHSFGRYTYVNNNPYKYNDPDGSFLNFAIGAGIGIVAEVVVQKFVEGKSLSQIDYGKVAQSGLVGALSGGTGGAAAKLAGIAGKAIAAPASAMHQGASKIATGAATGAIGGATGTAVGDAATQAIETGTVDLSQVAGAAAFGAVTGGLAGAAGGAVQANAALKTLGDARAQTVFTSTQPGAAAAAATTTAADAAFATAEAVSDACQQKAKGC